jgi:hypothetical protein
MQSRPFFYPLILHLYYWYYFFIINSSNVKHIIICFNFYVNMWKSMKVFWNVEIMA